MATSGDQKRRSSIAKICFPFGFGGGAGSSSSSSPAAANHKFMASDVGLGIIASMNDAAACNQPPAGAISRTVPLPIAGEKRRLPPAGDVMDEQSETYTCVISYREGQPVKKRVYYGDAAADHRVVPFELSPTPTPQLQRTTLSHSGDFLSQCFRCKDDLPGKDIYMYREEAFCSEECRGKAMVLDELKRRFREGGKTLKKINPPLRSSSSSGS